MNELGNKYALAAIRERRGRDGGGDRVLTEAAPPVTREHGACGRHDSAVRPGGRPTKIPGKRPYKRVKLFGAGKLNRLILGALRRGGRPMATGEVVAAIVEELGYGPEATKGMTNRVRANLRYLRDTRKLVTKEGDRESTRWALKDGAGQR